ncbi:UNVERIFIED_ORG: hypothetical protein L601_000800000350 [Gordonia westfalica J30]
MWCDRNGYEGWECTGPEPGDGSYPDVFEVWCKERRMWAAEHGYWPGDPEDNGDDRRGDDPRVLVVRLAEELDEAINGDTPDAPWSAVERFL